MTLADLGGWPATLATLTAGRDLSRDHAAAAMDEILQGAATSAQIAGLCIALRAKGETVEEICGLLDSLLEQAERVPLAPGTDVVDTCGTGGDRSGTINVSTVAALVVAGAGAPVCKHGNRAATSACGSADVLEALGVAIELGPADVGACIEEAGIGFCFAPRFHSALRHAGPTRRELGVPTVFNFLGPLANPARARRQVVGVSDPSMAPKLIGVLQANGSERALVVYGNDGLDELSTTTTSVVLELRDGRVSTYEVDPADLGLAMAERASLVGAGAESNAGAARRVLDGEPGPHRDIILLNAAAGLVVAGRADGLEEGLEVARDSIDSGAAGATLDRLVEASRKRAGSAP